MINASPRMYPALSPAPVELFLVAASEDCWQCNRCDVDTPLSYEQFLPESAKVDYFHIYRFQVPSLNRPRNSELSIE